MWEPMVRFLEFALGDIEVELCVLDQDAMAQALRRGELDVVFTNPAHYIRLRTENHLSGAIVTQVNIEHERPVSKLGGVVIRHKDRKDLSRLEDLEGAKVAITGREYLGGYLAQAAWLTDHGIDLSAIRFVPIGSPHDKVVEAVANREFDAGFIRSGILESMAAAGSPLIDQLEVIEPIDVPGFPFVTTTRVYPEWAVVAMPHLDQNVARRLASALLSLDHTDGAAKAAGLYGFAIPEDYRPVEEAMIALRMPPFDVVPKVTWLEFARQHQDAVALGLLIVLILMSASTVFLWLHRRLKAAALLTEVLNQRFNDLANNLPGVLFQYRLDSQGHAHFPFVSARAPDIYGCTPQELERDATKVFAVIHPDDVGFVEKSVQESARQMSVWNATYRIRHSTRGEVWVEVSSTPTRQADGSIVWHGFLSDITELQRSRQALKLAGQIIRSTSDGVVILDRQGRVVEVNPAFEAMTHMQGKSIQGQRLTSLDPTLFGEDDHVVQPGRREAQWTRPYGDVLPVLVSVSPVNDEHGVVSHYVVVAKDIHEMRSKQDQLDRLAHYDALTGLPNRRMLADRLEQAVALAKRTSEPLALVMLDLDEFKPVNDRYGHKAGDQLLVEIAGRLRDSIREGDTVARLGGDEFTLVLWNTQGDAAFERIIENVRQPVQIDGAVVRVGASLGVACFDPDHPLDGEQLMRQADQALYQSKQSGRNRFTIFR